MFIPDGVIYLNPNSPITVSGSEMDLEYLEDFEILQIKQKVHTPVKPQKSKVSSTEII